MSVVPNRLLSLSIFFYRGYGVLVGYFVNHPLYTPPSKLTFKLSDFNWPWLKCRISFVANFMLVRKNLIFSLIFDVQYYYAIDLQTDDKGRMTPYLLLERMSKLSFLYNYVLFFFCHVLLLHKHLGKNKIEKLDLHLCDLVITVIVLE